jgi:hypothetical protein
MVARDEIELNESDGHADNWREKAHLETTESKLSYAKARKLRLSIDIRAANAAADVDDKQAVNRLIVLNRESAAACRLVTALEAEVKEAERRLGLGRDQAAAMMRPLRKRRHSLQWGIKNGIFKGY